MMSAATTIRITPVAARSRGDRGGAVNTGAATRNHKPGRAAASSSSSTRQRQGQFFARRPASPPAASASASEDVGEPLLLWDKAARKFVNPGAAATTPDDPILQGLTISPSEVILRINKARGRGGRLDLAGIGLTVVPPEVGLGQRYWPRHSIPCNSNKRGF